MTFHSYPFCNIKVNEKGLNGNTPLHNACYMNYVKIVSMLLNHPSIDVNVRNDEHRDVEMLNGDLSIRRMVQLKQIGKY